MNFGFLEQYKVRPFENPSHATLVYGVNESEIKKAEKKLGFLFPGEIRNFYEKIGYSKICETRSGEVDLYNQNYILPPMVAATFYEAILRFQEKEIEEPVECDGFYMNNSIIDLFEPGDLPFFEISDSDSFMVLKPKSENPNAVWYMGQEKIEESLEQFIYKLYHVSTDYYAESW